MMSLKRLLCTLSVIALAFQPGVGDTMAKDAEAVTPDKATKPDAPIPKDDDKPSPETTEKAPKADLEKATFFDGVLAVVNKEVVTVQDVYSESRFLERQNKLGYAPSEWEREEIRDEFQKKAHTIRVSIANRLVNELLISAEFIRRGYQLPESIVDQRVHKAAANAAKGDLEVLRDQLKTSGLTMTGFRERIRRRLHNDILLGNEVFETIKISPHDIQEFRKRFKDQFKPVDTYKLGVLFYVTAKDEAATIVAKHVEDLLAEGKDINEINEVLKADKALQALKPGSLLASREEDWMPLGAIDSRFQPYVKTLKKGEMSPVIRLKGKVFLLTALDVRKGEEMDENIVYMKVRGRLLYLKRKKAQRDFVRRLYNQSYVRKFYQE
jgi:pyruvate/2-oxoglutarate dehydrogenase complex dihydrolipoamide acyltransferase (E2) component